MKVGLAVLIAAPFFLFGMDASPQGASYRLPLRAILNGQVIPDPARVFIKSGSGSTSIPVIDSKFAVPKELLTDPTFDFQCEIGKETIRAESLRVDTLEAS